MHLSLFCSGHAVRFHHLSPPPSTPPAQHDRVPPSGPPASPRSSTTNASSISPRALGSPTDLALLPTMYPSSRSASPHSEGTAEELTPPQTQDTRVSLLCRPCFPPSCTLSPSSYSFDSAKYPCPNCTTLQNTRPCPLGIRTALHSRPSLHVACKEPVVLQALVITTVPHVLQRIRQHKVRRRSGRLPVLQLVQHFQLSEVSVV